jgi:raffinose/stachyose/melibiose transport system substrate-binding protein
MNWGLAEMKKAFAVVMACGLILSACGAKTETNGNGSASANTAAPKNDKPVELKFWSFEPKDEQNRQIFKEIIDNFNNTHPNIKLKPDYFDDEAFKAKMKVALAGNDLPDIFSYWTGDQFKTLVEGNAVGDITSKLNSDSTFKDRILQAGLDAYTYNGKNYAIPLQLNAVLLWYNKDILQQNNITPPKTWDELVAAVDKLNASNITPIAVAGKDRWPLLHWFSYLQERVGGDETFDAANQKDDFTGESFVKAGEMLNDFAIKHKAFENGFLGIDYGAAESMFTNGKSAFYQQGDWAVSSFTKSPEFMKKVGFVPFPTVSGGKGDLGTYQGGFGIGYAISAQAAKEKSDAAYEALKYLSDPVTRTKLIQANGVTPAFKDFKAPEGMSSLAVEVMNNASKVKKTFPYYDQALDPKRTEAVLNASTAIAGKEGIDVKAELAKIKKH